jgi:hypothetical protein
VTIYLNATGRVTDDLLRYLDQRQAEINQIMVIDYRTITPDNKQAIVAAGIRQSPTMIYVKPDGHRVIVEGSLKIKQHLTPATKRVDDYEGNLNPEELVQREMMKEMANRHDQEPDTKQLSQDSLMQKFTMFQQKRPKMEGLRDKDKVIPGGRALPRGTPAATPTYEDDSSFLSASQRDNVASTPAAMYEDEQDGDRIIEEDRYQQAEALRGMSGSRAPVKPWRKPRVDE